MGSLRGGPRGDDAVQGQGQGRGLSDLWSGDSPGAGGLSQVEERGSNSSSLRRAPLGGRRLGAQVPQQQQQESLNVRPLPSQRAGSYQMQNQAYAQQQQHEGTGSPGPAPGSSGGSAQERLKARLGRGGSTGSGGGGQVQGSYATQGLSGWQGRR